MGIVIGDVSPLSKQQPLLDDACPGEWAASIKNLPTWLWSNNTNNQLKLYRNSWPNNWRPAETSSRLTGASISMEDNLACRSFNASISLMPSSSLSAIRATSIATKKKKPKPKTKKQKRKKYGFRHINKKEKKTHRKGHNVWLLRCRQLVGKLVSDIESLSYLIISLTQTNETISRLASYSIMPRERRNINLPVLVRNRYVTIPPSPPLLNTESQPKTFPV